MHGLLILVRSDPVIRPDSVRSSKFTTLMVTNEKNEKKKKKKKKQSKFW